MRDRILNFNKVTTSHFDYMNTFLSKSIKKTYKQYQLKKHTNHIRQLCIGKGWLILVKLTKVEH